MIDEDERIGDEIICPHCEYEFRDSWEHADVNRPSTLSCRHCEQFILVETDVRVTFISRKPKEEEE